MKRALFWTILCAAALGATGCGWQTYLASRTISHFTGKPTRLHSIMPLNGRLDRYQVLEVKPLENLLLEQLPPQMEEYLDREIFLQLKTVRSKPEVVTFDETRKGTGKPALVLEGYIDDYDPGYFGLRLVELGFNHVAVTVRFELRDKQSGQIVGSASITAQDDRITATPKTAINTIAKRIRGFVNAGYGGSK